MPNCNMCGRELRQVGALYVCDPCSLGWTKTQLEEIAAAVVSGEDFIEIPEDELSKEPYDAWPLSDSILQSQYRKQILEYGAQ